MKKHIPTLVLLVATTIFATSCDSPRTARSIISSQSGNSLTGNGTTTGSGIDLGGTTTDNTTGTTTNTNIPSDSSHCKFSTDGVNGFESTSTHLGSYTLCQSSTDKNSFYMQVKTPPVGSSGDVSICFIPHTTSGSNSIYVGNPMCGTFSDPKTVKKITFVKYTQYSSALINSVMFFKDTSYYYSSPYNRTMMTLDAYKTCMNALAYNNAYYCQAFKTVGQYVLKSF